MRGLIVFTALLAVAYGIAPLQRAKETIKGQVPRYGRRKLSLFYFFHLVFIRFFMT